MSRHPYSIQRVYIADGFVDDCDELIHRCSRVDLLSYQAFCIYYKDMNFASMFQGRTSNSEIAELSEELLQIAKYYMVLDTSNFEESVAGLFLVYALMNLQPFPRFAHLRIVPEDLPAIARIEQVARRERRYDVLYILGSVLVRGPVQYHVANRERGMESTIRKYLEGPCGSIDKTGVRPKGVYFRQNEELDIIREMSGIFKRYSKAKEQIPGLKRRGLSYSNDNLADDLGTSLKRLINGIVDEAAETDPPDHYNAVQEIKKRAMRGAVGTVKHLAAADLRSPEKKSPQQVNETVSEVVPSTSTPKRASKTKPKAVKLKRPRNDLSDSSTSSSEELEDDDFWTKKGKSPASHTFDKTDDETNREQEINVEIDSLPPIMTTESEGKVVQIEIIDKMKKVKEKKIARPKRKRAEEKNDDAIFKKPLQVSPKIRLRTRREMKQPILKSKFKKMGMLPVANFEEK